MPPTEIEDALDFAIKREEESIRLYAELAEMARRPEIRTVLLGFSREEEGHKAKLLRMKDLVRGGATPKPPPINVQDLHLADYLVDEQPSPDMDYQAILIVAMKKEKAAFRLYTDMAEMTEDPGLRDTFLALAQEEAKHKLRFEVEYDDYVLSQN